MTLYVHAVTDGSRPNREYNREYLLGTCESIYDAWGMIVEAYGEPTSLSAFSDYWAWVVEYPLGALVPLFPKTTYTLAYRADRDSNTRRVILMWARENEQPIQVFEMVTEYPLSLEAIRDIAEDNAILGTEFVDLLTNLNDIGRGVCLLQFRVDGFPSLLSIEITEDLLFSEKPPKNRETVARYIRDELTRFNEWFRSGQTYSWPMTSGMMAIEWWRAKYGKSSDGKEYIP